MNKGLTLIETLLYLALLSILISSAVPILIDLNFWQSKNNQIANATSDFLFVDGQVRNLVKNAREIIEPEDGNESSVLVLDSWDHERITLSLNKGQIVLDQDGNSYVLNASTTNFQSLAFSRTGSPPLEKILMNVSANNWNFGTTTYLIQSD